MMKSILLFTFMSISLFLQGQSLPIDFEGDITTANFTDFNGGEAMVIANPQSSGINTSATVAQIVRDGGEIWAGSKIILAENLDFSSLSAISMKVFTTAPIGTVVKFKLETDGGSVERDVNTTTNNNWETLTWDFTGVPNNFNQVVFMFDFGNIGDGSINSTFLFDDVEQFYTGEQIDLPVDFEGDVINYTMTDFGGNSSSLTTDPEDANNKVIQVVKPVGSATWAGTTIGTPAGFATNIPLSLTDSKMSVRVWSSVPGTPIRLKVEDSNDPTHTCETETNSTVENGWEVIEFDFLNQAPGTELLSIGLQMGWTYNMASIFFNFGTDGDTAGETMYFFDDVKFGFPIIATENISLAEISVYPNPTQDAWLIQSDNSVIEKVELLDATGKHLMEQKSENKQLLIDGSLLSSGIYMARIYTQYGIETKQLVRL